MRAAPEAKAAPVPHRSGWWLGLELPPRQTVSQWADAKRIIAQGTGPEPGRWRTDRTPYLRQPMDAFCDPDVETVVLMMSSQVGKTEVLINVTGYFIDHDPAPMLLVLPTLDLADSFSTKRFTPTAEATPALLERLGGHRKRDTSSTIREKAFPGGDLVFAGANSPASLASRPRRIALFDEVDKYKANVGSDGSPIKQGVQRTQNFWNRKIGLASTPDIEGLSEIDDWFKRSDQRYYEVPCHACGEFAALEWEHVDWPGRETAKAEPAKAFYACPACGGVWDQRQLSTAVRHGHWKAKAAFNGIAGFRVWAIYSPWVTMADLAAEWEQAQGKPGEEQAFVNLKLGRPYNPTRSAQATPAMLHGRREDYGPQMLPDGVLLVTAFVDLQGDRVEVQYLGWGADDEKWVIDYAVKYGDPSDPQAWEALDRELLQRSFPHPAGGVLPIEAVGVDAGYMQQVVLEFVRTRKAAFRPFYAVKGMPGDGRPLWKESDERFKLGARLHLSGIDDGKTTLYAELAQSPTEERPDARLRVHFPRHLELEYFEQLVSERVKIEWTSGRPRRKWVPGPKKRNEALDTFVGNMCMRASLSIDYAARRAAMSRGAERPDYSRIADLFAKG